MQTYTVNATIDSSKLVESYAEMMADEDRVEELHRQWRERTPVGGTLTFRVTKN